MDDILVSINCITYNHEDYISEALEGFLMQITNFKYEILIHDDASTDKTAELIRVYQNKYPDLIKPIYQAENQYSQGKKPSLFNFNRAKGKYIAFCEGDDYWTDPHKLQKQVDFMEANPEYSICGHATKVIDVTLNEEIEWIYKKFGKDMELPLDILSDQLFFQTATMIIRSEHIFRGGYPEFYNISPNGDFTLQLWMAHVGKAYYFDDIMSVHRKFAPHSYNVKYFRTESQRINNAIKQIEMLNEFNKYSKGKHLSIIQKKIENLEKNIEIMKNSVYMVQKERVLDTKIPNPFENIKRNDIYIFPASIEGKKILDLLNKSNINTIGFIDNNVDLHGKSVNEKRVFPIDDVDIDSLILVASTHHAKDLVNQLIDLGFTNYNIIRNERF